MARVVVRSCAALLFLIACGGALAHTAAQNPSRSPAEWMKGYTLVLVDAGSKAELAEARDFIVAQGGTVAVVIPPRAILGWVSPEVGARIVGRSRIRSIHRSPVESAIPGYTDRETQVAIKLFNDIVSGREARRIEREAAKSSGPENDRPPMPNCAEPNQPVSRNALIRNLQSMGAQETLRNLQSEIKPQFFGASDVMDGTIAVAVFLVESNGRTDPDIYSWSQADQATAIAKVVDGLNWWVDQSRAFNLGRPLQFTVVPFLASNPVSQQPYEPILHPGSDANAWATKIMENVGSNFGNVHERVASFNLRLRDENHANWGFSIFIAYNPPPSNTYYTDGRASWAYVGGPHVHTLFRSFGWPLSQLISHEVGHIFYACDEYSQPGYATCSCTCAPEVRREALNGNCQEGVCNGASVPCMMRVNEFALCPYTVAQIGWTSSVPRPVPTAPQGLVATASSPTQVNIIWQDTSNVEEGFQIERRGGSSADYNQIAVLPANSTSYNDGSALSNTAYVYRVRAFNGTGTSSYSSEASVVTPSVTPALSVGTTSLPEATVTVPYSRTITASGGKPDYTWLVESGALPPGLSLSQSGDITGTPTTAGTYNFVARVTDSASSSATKALTLLVKPTAPLTITSLQLPRGSVGATYSQNVGVSGGQTPYTWAIQSGNLPDGLTLSPATGVISGTPEKAGTSSFVIRVTDATSATVTATLSITVNPGISVLSLDTVSLPDGVVGESYSHTLTASGGTTPYKWELIVGKLPEGLQMSEAGVITGRPTAQGEVEFDVRVSDQSGQSITKRFAIEVDPAPQLTILTPNSLSVAAVGVPYRVELRASAGSAPYTWNKKKKKKFGTLPDGITLSSEGILSGTPTTQGTYSFTLQVIDAGGKVASKPFTLEVGPPPPPLAIKTETLPQATQNVPYSTRVEATGGTGAYTWTIDSGALPEGLTMSSDGLITGRPNVPGTAAFTVRVRDSIGTVSATQLFIIVGQPPPPLVIQTVSLPETTAERAYSQRLQATGGVAPYTWSIASGNLGSGLNLSADGLISGTPLTAGTSVFVVRVTDSAQAATTRTLAIQVKPADKLAPFGNLETPGFNATLANTATGTGWALDNIGVASVEVLVDGEKVGEAVYGQSRPDIGAVWGSFPNAGGSGFTFAFDTTKFSNGDHTLAVRVLDAAGNATLIGTRKITLQNRVFLITTTEVPRGKKGEAYSFQLLTANGRSPYFWTVTSGSLPPGLSLDASGRISGTPTTIGTFAFSVRVTDAGNASAIASYTQVINPDIELLRVITNGDLLIGLTGVEYRDQLIYTGGTRPVQWGLASGTLPPGLTIGEATGLITGKPLQTGGFFFTVRVTDATHASADSSLIRIIVQPGPLSVINAGLQTAGGLDLDYTLQLTAVGGTAPYTWAMAGGSLPTGLSLASGTGIISGKPTESGSFTFTVKVTDSRSGSATSAPLTINVTAVAVLAVTSSGDLTAGKVNTDYSHQLTFVGGTPPHVWAMASGSLPPGLSLNSATGVIAGKPTQVGTFTFTVKLTDSKSATATSSPLTISVTGGGGFAITSNGDLTVGKVNNDYSHKLNATGGQGPFVWTLETGTLPPGIILNAVTGVLSGTPIQAGTFNFTVRLRDSTEQTVVSPPLRITIAP